MGVKDLGTASGGSVSVPAFGSTQDGGIIGRAHRYVPAPGGVAAVCQLCGKPKGTSHLPPRPLGRGKRLARRLGRDGKPVDHKDGKPVDLESKLFSALLHPRDKRGKFATVGAAVELADGRRGTVSAINKDGKVEVRTSSGEQAVAGHNLRVLFKAPDHANAGSHVPRAAGYGVTGDAVAARGDGATPMAAGRFPHGDPRNDPAYLKYTEGLDKKINDALAARLDSASMNSVRLPDGSSTYTPARDAEHTAIIDKIMADHVAVPNDRKAVMLGGLPGAGKSTFLWNYGAKLGLKVDGQGNPTNAIVINPDEMKSLLLNRNGADGKPMVARVPGLTDGEHASLVHAESSHLAKMLSDHALAEGKNVVFDITLGNASKANAKYLTNARGTGAKDKGYKVQAAFVDGNMATSLHRAGLRHKNLDKGTGQRTMSGRYVPYSHIAGEGVRPGDPLTSDGKAALSHNRTQYDALVKAGAFTAALRYDNLTGQFTKDA